MSYVGVTMTSNQDRFWLSHSIGKCLGIYHINWNKITKKYEENHSFQAKKCVITTSIIVFFFLIYALVGLFAKNKWDKEDVIFLAEILVMTVGYVFILLYPYVKQKEIITTLDCINCIDVLMAKCTIENTKNRPKNKYLYYLSCAYIPLLSEVMVALITYFLRSDL